MEETVIQVVGTLFLFVLVLVVAWWTTRLIGYGMNGQRRGRMIRVLEHVPAGRDRSIMLIEVGGRVYLVGAATEQVGLLDRIDDPEVVRRLLEGAAAQPANPLAPLLPDSFKQMLAKVQANRPTRDR